MYLDAFVCGFTNHKAKRSVNTYRYKSQEVNRSGTTANNRLRETMYFHCFLRAVFLGKEYMSQESEPKPKKIKREPKGKGKTPDKPPDNKRKSGVEVVEDENYAPEFPSIMWQEEDGE
jgi:hypothetical protein